MSIHTEFTQKQVSIERAYLMDLRQALISEQWRLHEKLANVTYEGTFEQQQDFAQMGKVTEAIEAVRAAASAIGRL